MITLDIAQIPRPTPSLVAWQVRDVSAHEMGGLLRRVQAFTPLLIVAFLFALYGYTLGYGMYWDDYHFIRPWSLSETASVWVGSFDPNNIEPPYFRPLTSVTYALDGLIWGYNVFGSHLTNLFFYGVVAVLLYALLRRMGASWLLATATALFFCVVPINAASVVYISERGDSLVAIWVLAGMLFFDSYWRTARVRWLVGANVAFGLALCSKEIGTGLFLLFGLYVCAAAVGTATQTSPRTDRENSVAYIRRVAGEIWRIVTAGDARRRLISAFVPSLVLLLVYVGYRALVLPSFVNTYKANGNIFSAYASAVQWTFRAVPWSWGSLQPFTSALLAGALGATILFCRRSQLWPLFFFGIGWVLVACLPLAPLLGNVDTRLLFVPSLGYAISGMALFGMLVERLTLRRRARGFWVEGVLIVGLALATFATGFVNSRRATDEYAPFSLNTLAKDELVYNNKERLEFYPAPNVAVLRDKLIKAGRIPADGR